MLGYVTLMFVAFLSAKLALGLRNHKAAFETHGVGSARYTLLRLSPLLYIVSLLGLLPFSGFDWFRPVPIGFLMLLPGVILGKKVARTLERVGIDRAIEAARAATNIMWLGIGTALFMAGNIGFVLIVRGVGSDIPG